MKIKVGKESLFYIAIFLIVLCNNKFLCACGLDSIVEYLAFFIILFYTFVYRLKTKKFIYFLQLAIVLFMFCIGIFMQNLSVGIKKNLIFSMIILASIAVVPNGILRRPEDLRKLKTSIICGIVVSTLLAILSRYGVFTVAVEGMFAYGFDAGLLHKNYFAYICISLFLFELILRNYSNKKQNWKSLIWILLILVANSRSAWIMLAIVFWILQNNAFKQSKTTRSIMIFFNIAAIVLVLILLYQDIALSSESFAYRLRGVENYINYYKGDVFHLVFGNAEMAFRNSGQSYVDNIRSVVGWNGTVEIAYLNILIKNGLIGIVGYLLIFLIYIKKIVTLQNLQNSKVKTLIYTFLTVFILSGLFEAFVGNINLSYSVISYLFLCNIATGDRFKNEQ